MADDKFNLTDLDREKLKNSSTYSLPDNPSDKQFSAAQIKKAMYQPSLMLFDWMKEGFDDIEDKEEEFDEKLADKVDKLKTANKIYGTDANGDDTGISFSIDPIANTFPKRDNNGDILVSETPQNDKSAVSRSHLTTKLTELYNTIDNEKISKPTIPVTIEHAIVQTASGFGVMQINSNPYANTIVRRSLTGTVKTTNGVENNDAASYGQLLTEINRATMAENDIMAVASGKSKSITISIAENPSFDSEEKIISFLGTIKDVNGKVWTLSELKVGDNIFITELNKKDRWYIGSGQFSILEADTSFLVNYQKKLIPNADNGILLDASGNIQANVSFALLKGSWMDNPSLDTEINKKQNKVTSYNFNTDSTKTVFYQTTAPVHAPHGALWMSQAAGVQVSFVNILGSIADNVISDTYIKNLIKSKTDRNVISTIEATYSGDDVKIKTLQVNLWSQNAQYNTFNLNLANATTAGLMSYEDYNTLIAHTQKLAQLEGRMKRISYDLKDHPTESEIDAYVRGLGYEEVDFPYLKVIVYATKHMWLYYTLPTARWQDDGIDSAAIFTNATAGLIKGAATAGKVFAESDGTGSVFGWDGLNTNVANNTAAIASIQADLPNYMPKSGGTFTGNVNMQGHIINMLGGYVKNVKEGSVDDAVPKKWITAQLANYLPISGGNITGDLSITGTLTVNTFELSNNLDAKTHKIINLGNPTNATDAANKDYVDLGDDNLSDLISTEVNARIEADNTIMLSKTVDPSSASVGTLGQLWKNTTNGKLFKCESISGSTYTWVEIKSNSGTGYAKLDTANTFTEVNTFTKSINVKDGYSFRAYNSGDTASTEYDYNGIHRGSLDFTLGSRSGIIATILDITDKIKSGTDSISSSVVGVKGQLYEDLTKGILSICKNANDSNYTWANLLEQHSSMPTISPQYNNQIIQYIGETSGNYIKGHFYKGNANLNPYYEIHCSTLEIPTTYMVKYSLVALSNTKVRLYDDIACTVPSIYWANTSGIYETDATVAEIKGTVDDVIHQIGNWEELIVTPDKYLNVIESTNIPTSLNNKIVMYDANDNGVWKRGHIYHRENGNYWEITGTDVMSQPFTYYSKVEPTLSPVLVYTDYSCTMSSNYYANAEHLYFDELGLLEQGTVEHINAHTGTPIWTDITPQTDLSLYRKSADQDVIDLTKLSLTGGTMTGIISFNEKFSIGTYAPVGNTDPETSKVKRLNNIGRVVFYGGSDWDKGGFMEFYGDNIPENFYTVGSDEYNHRRGQFTLGTGQNDGSYEFIGKTNGDLIWKHLIPSQASEVLHIALRDKTTYTGKSKDDLFAKVSNFGDTYIFNAVCFKADASPDGSTGSCWECEVHSTGATANKFGYILAKNRNGYYICNLNNGTWGNWNVFRTKTNSGSLMLFNALSDTAGNRFVVTAGTTDVDSCIILKNKNASGGAGAWLRAADNNDTTNEKIHAFMINGDGSVRFGSGKPNSLSWTGTNATGIIGDSGWSTIDSSKLGTGISGTFKIRIKNGWVYISGIDVNVNNSSSASTMLLIKDLGSISINQIAYNCIPSGMEARGIMKTEYGMSWFAGCYAPTTGTDAGKIIMQCNKQSITNDKGRFDMMYPYQ